MHFSHQPRPDHHISGPISKRRTLCNRLSAIVYTQINCHCHMTPGELSRKPGSMVWTQTLKLICRCERHVKQLDFKHGTGVSNPFWGRICHQLLCVLGCAQNFQVFVLQKNPCMQQHLYTMQSAHVSQTKSMLCVNQWGTGNSAARPCLQPENHTCVCRFGDIMELAPKTLREKLQEPIIEKALS